MTENDKTILQQFEDKLRRLLYKYEEQKSLNESLIRQIEEKEASLKELQMRHSALEQNYHNLKQAKMISLSDAEIGETRARLSRLVREIDRCIESLNKQ